jgi:exonuclease III
MDMRFATWNVSSLYTIGYLTTVPSELGKYKLDIVGVQEVRWEKCGTELTEFIDFLRTGEWGSSVRDRIFLT